MHPLCRRFNPLYLPYHPPYEGGNYGEYYLKIADREHELYLIESGMRKMRASYVHFLHKELGYKKIRQLDKVLRSLFVSEVLLDNHVAHGCNKRRYSDIYKRAWLRMDEKMVDKHHDDVMFVIYERFALFCMGRLELKKEQISGMMYMLDNLLAKNKEIPPLSGINLEMVDVRTTEDINTLATQLIRYVLEEKIPVSFAESFCELLRRKMEFIQAYQSEKLDNLEHVVNEMKQNQAKTPDSTTLLIAP